MKIKRNQEQRRRDEGVKVEEGGGGVLVEKQKEANYKRVFLKRFPNLLIAFSIIYNLATTSEPLAEGGEQVHAVWTELSWAHSPAFLLSITGFLSSSSAPSRSSSAYFLITHIYYHTRLDIYPITWRQK